MKKHRHEWAYIKWDERTMYLMCKCGAAVKSVYKGMTYVPDENLER